MAVRTVEVTIAGLNVLLAVAALVVLALILSGAERPSQLLLLIAPLALLVPLVRLSYRVATRD